MENHIADVAVTSKMEWNSTFLKRDKICVL